MIHTLNFLLELRNTGSISIHDYSFLCVHLKNNRAAQALKIDFSLINGITHHFRLFHICAVESAAEVDTFCYIFTTESQILLLHFTEESHILRLLNVIKNQHKKVPFALRE
jgi:hypothetical protein